MRYIEGETTPIGVTAWSGDDTDNIDDSNDCDIVPMIEFNRPSICTGLLMDSDEENKSRLLKYQQIFNSNKNMPLNEVPVTMAMMTSRKDSSSSFSKFSCFQPSHRCSYFDSFLSTTSMPISNELKREI